jgi:hypothetical protein
MNRRLLCLLILLTGGTACVDPEIVVPDVMTVVALLPSHGSVDIGVDVQPLIYFSHEAASQAEAEASFSLSCLGAPALGSCNSPNATTCLQADVDATVDYDTVAQVARLTPTAPLQATTCYVLVVAAGLEASLGNVGPLPVEIRSSFITE